VRSRSRHSLGDAESAPPLTTERNPNLRDIMLMQSIYYTPQLWLPQPA